MGIDRFMSEARAVTNFAGNAVATVLIGSWTKELDRAQVQRVFSGQDPFDEQNLTDGHGGDDSKDESTATREESNSKEPASVNPS